MKQIRIGLLAISAQEAGEHFSIATLNVDGLPQKTLVLELNADGPGDAGTARIGKYLKNKGYDLVMMQEDFNYHGVLSVWLEDDYKMDEWSGDVGIEGHDIDFFHLQNHRFECDGLMACWKNDLQVTAAARTPWTQNFGKFSHANDEIITKGFRRYDVNLRSGDRIVVYNLHMDATMEEDEIEMKGEKDRVITEREPSGLPVVLFEVHAHAAVIGTIKVELTDLEFLLIDDNITEHNQLLEQFFAK